MKYRSKILLVFLLTIAITGASAQKITGGMKAGINLATIIGDEDEIGDPGYKIGFCGGGFVSFGLGDVVVIQPEFLYSQKGARWEEVVLDETMEAKYIFNYLEIPLFIKMIMPIQGKIKPNIFVGPYFGIMIATPRARMEVDGMSMEVELDEEVKNTDFGVVFGAGVDFGVGRGKIVFDVRYGLGLITLDKAGDPPVDVKNGAFSFLLGYSF